MRRNPRIACLLALVVMLAAAPALARVDFKPIAGGEFVSPMDFSADGTKLVLSGYFGFPYYTWTASEGLVAIGGGCGAGTVSISPDGGTIVGCDINADGAGEAAKWLGGTQWLLMGTEPGGVPCDTSLSSTFDNNGTTAVGLFWRPAICRAIGGTWDLTAGVAGPVLESTVPDRPTRGNGITDDGSIVVGWQDAETGERAAVRWVNGVQEYITLPDGSKNGEATGVNSDGSVIWGVGYGYQGDGTAWLYRAGQGFTRVGNGGIGTNVDSVITGAKDDGSFVIGITRNFLTGVQTGWVWDAKKGYSTLNDYLKGQIAAGWDLSGPNAISRDGRYIAGIGINPSGDLQAFIIDLKAKGPK